MTAQTQIYVARHEHGFVKIGKSDDPVSRISSLQTACPYQIRLFTTITVDGDWSVVEAALHNAFDDQRLQGEWFDIKGNQLRDLVEIKSLDPETVRSFDDFTPDAYIKRRNRQRGKWLLRGQYSLSGPDAAHTTESGGD